MLIFMFHHFQKLGLGAILKPRFRDPRVKPTLKQTHILIYIVIDYNVFIFVVYVLFVTKSCDKNTYLYLRLAYILIIQCTAQPNYCVNQF